MKYFIDTEFIEKPGSIQLISIGIAAEDGRAYYGICKDFDLREAWENEWLQKNVLLPLHKELIQQNLSPYDRARNTTYIAPTRKALNNLLTDFGKTTKEIAKEIMDYINLEGQMYDHGIGLNQVVSAFTQADAWSETFYPKEFEYIKKHNTFMPDTVFSSGVDGKGADRNRARIYNQPQFYGYFADYDWVVFCWIFGKMIDLPKGFPMYCRDLKQMMDDRGLTKKWKRDNCPDPENEHNALADAEWNKKLYNLILKYDNELSGRQTAHD
jgi:hypothetical protein